MSELKKQQAILKFVKLNDFQCPIFAVNSKDNIEGFELMNKIRRSFDLRHPTSYNPIYEKQGTLWAQFGKNNLKFISYEFYKIEFLPIIGKTSKGKTFLNLKIYSSSYIEPSFELLEF